MVQFLLLYDYSMIASVSAPSGSTISFTPRISRTMTMSPGSAALPSTHPTGEAGSPASPDFLYRRKGADACEVHLSGLRLCV